jgi:hypothetical protein
MVQEEEKVKEIVLPPGYLIRDDILFHAILSSTNQ